MYRPLGFGEIVLPRALVGRHVTDLLDDAVFVKSDPGAAERTLSAGLAELMREHPAVEC